MTVQIETQISVSEKHGLTKGEEVENDDFETHLGAERFMGYQDALLGIAATLPAVNLSVLFLDTSLIEPNPLKHLVWTKGPQILLFFFGFGMIHHCWEVVTKFLMLAEKLQPRHMFLCLVNMGIISFIAVVVSSVNKAEGANFAETEMILILKMVLHVMVIFCPS